MEAVTLIDLLRRAEITVVTAALEPGLITASRGVVIKADVLLDEVLDQDFDLILLPGGLPGSDHLARDLRIIELLKKQADQDRWIGAICAAPKALAAASLLDGKKATAYPGVLEALANETIQIQDSAIQWDGNIATSRGPGTAMDFALSWIEKLSGPEKRHQVEAGLSRS